MMNKQWWINYLKRGERIMNRLTKNILRHEIRCKCGECKNDTIDYMVISAVQKICDIAAEKIKVNKVILHITSGFRCEYWNGHEGGRANSKHPKGKAMDFSIKGFTAKDIDEIIKAHIDLDIYDYYLITDTIVHIEYDPK